MSRPVVVFYHMIGCPHCEATWPAWRDLKRSSEGMFKEVESKDAKGISGFPTFVVLRRGKEVRRLAGEQTDANALAQELGLRRKTTRRRGTYRRGRTLRNRTFGRNIPLR